MQPKSCCSFIVGQSRGGTRTESSRGTGSHGSHVDLSAGLRTPAAAIPDAVAPIREEGSMPSHNVLPTCIEQTSAVDVDPGAGAGVGAGGSPRGTSAVQAIQMSEEQVDEMALTYEAGLAYCLAWLSYIAASAAFLSGITAIISSGALMRAKMRPHMSPHSAQRLDMVASVRTFRG